jgi:3-dehydroquinate synthase II
MKLVWVQSIPFDKDIAIAALESGADALLVEEGVTPRVKELGVLKTIAPDGDIQPGRDIEIVEVKTKKDEDAASRVPIDKLVVLRMDNWKIIPVENLIAARGGIVVEVTDAVEAKTMAQVLEKGADGVLLVSKDPAEVRKTVSSIRDLSEPIDLVTARITEITPLGMGDRVCVDTCSMMQPGEGMLVGNSASASFLVHSESIENPYVEARPFRVNAGAVHAYTLGPEGRTNYLSELKAGSSVLLVNHEGATRAAHVGRCKTERRPMVLVRAQAGGTDVSLVLQNAETIRLVRPDGSALSVAAVKVGDEVLAHIEEGGRHFGVKVEETLQEK